MVVRLYLETYEPLEDRKKLEVDNNEKNLGKLTDACSRG